MDYRALLDPPTGDPPPTATNPVFVRRDSPEVARDEQRPPPHSHTEAGPSVPHRAALQPVRNGSVGSGAVNPSALARSKPLEADFPSHASPAALHASPALSHASPALAMPPPAFYVQTPWSANLAHQSYPYPGDGRQPVYHSHLYPPYPYGPHYPPFVPTPPVGAASSATNPQAMHPQSAFASPWGSSFPDSPAPWIQTGAPSTSSSSTLASMSSQPAFASASSAVAGEGLKLPTPPAHFDSAPAESANPHDAAAADVPLASSSLAASSRAAPEPGVAGRLAQTNEAIRVDDPGALEKYRQKYRAAAAVRGVDVSAEAIKEKEAELEGQRFYRPLAPQGLAVRAAALRMLTVFLSERDGLSTDEVTRKYLVKGAQPLTQTDFTSFLRWYSVVTVGKLDESKVPTVATVDKLFVTLSNALDRATGKPVPSDVSKQVHLYIAGTLRDDVGLSIKRREKVVPTGGDLMVLFAAMWDPYSSVWTCSRERLNVVIAVMLLVYGAGRPGEIVVSGGYRGTKKEDALRWKDIKWAIVPLPGGGATLTVVYTNRLLKGHRTDGTTKEVRLQVDRSNPRACPVLPLLAAAFEDDVFVQPPRVELLDSLALDGPVSIPIKEEMQDVYVLRDLGRSGNGVAPAGYDWLYRKMKEVGGEIGWLFVNTMYTWRRFSANALNRPEVTEADRKHLMGHRAASYAFEAYQSRRTQLDTQAIMLGQQEDRAALEAMGAAERFRGLPIGVSYAGRKAVMESDEMMAASSEVDQALRAFKSASPGTSLAQVLAVGAKEALEHQRVYKARNRLLRQRLREKFKAEVDEFVKQARDQRVADLWASEDAASKLFATSVDGHVLGSGNDAAATTGHNDEAEDEAEDRFEMFAALADVNIDGQEAATAIMLLDPEVSREDVARDFELAAELDDDDEIDSEGGEDEAPIGNGKEAGDGKETSGEDDADEASDEDDDEDKNVDGVFVAKARGFELLELISGPLSSSTVVSKVINLMRDESALPMSAKTDYPGCAATPEHRCADCNTARATAVHRLSCRTKAKAVEMAAASDLIRQTAAFVCTLPRCKTKKFAAAEDAAAHIGMKVANASKSGTPRVCVLDGCSDTVSPEGVTPTLETHYIHVERVHGFLSSTHKQTSTSLAQGLTNFCLICREFVFGRAAWDDHLRTHLDPLLALLRRDPASFAVSTSPNGTCTRPGLCPFCLYDETLTLNVRIQQFAEAKKLNRHIQQHIRDLAIADKESETPGTHDCPHTSCRKKTCGRNLSLVQLGDHLIDKHGLWWLGVTTRLGEGKAKRTKQRIESATRWDGSLDALKSAEPRKSAGKGKGKAKEDAAGDDDADGEGEGGAGPGPSTAVTARKRKRKTDGEDEVDGDDTPAPAKKARSSSKGKGKAKATEADDDNGDGDGAKAPAAAKKPRKTRSDAGKKRGPRKSKEAATPAVGAAPPAAGPSSSGIVAPSTSSAKSSAKSAPPAPPASTSAESAPPALPASAAKTSPTAASTSSSSSSTAAARTSAATAASAATTAPASSRSSTNSAVSSSTAPTTTAAPTTATAASPTSAERAYVNRKRRRVVSDSEDDV